MSKSHFEWATVHEIENFNLATIIYKEMNKNIESQRSNLIIFHAHNTFFNECNRRIIYLSTKWWEFNREKICMHIWMAIMCLKRTHFAILSYFVHLWIKLVIGYYNTVWWVWSDHIIRFNVSLERRCSYFFTLLRH